MSSEPISTEQVSPTLFAALEQLLEARIVDGADHPLTPGKPSSVSLVLDDPAADATPLPYRARINNLLSGMLSRHAREEAKAGERHTQETIERVKSELRQHAATHPKIEPLVTILLNSLPEIAVGTNSSDITLHSPRPIQA
jgi:hypothetical protein